MRMLLLVAGALMTLPAATLAQDTSGGVVRVEKPVTGEQVYGAVCQACHMADAKGAVGAGTIPALASNPKLAGAAYPIMVVARGQGAMPGFAGMLSNAQMAEAVTYVRTHFGNSYAKPVTEADVAKFAKPPAAGGH
ncbi:MULTISPECIES: cytochrome c [unclassified Caulobacter]|jgi:mono/diheme cytochrome c family protein|uniref:c-type cytochrome n=1 Tax=unclassified Caulobacter TaxID=2648921 RepID=UPI0007811907|nr:MULTISPECIES: cytochrome c [unclassified Caulobacter]AZS22371.1 cytochrome C [Caulobacter sp. FWC26]